MIADLSDPSSWPVVAAIGPYLLMVVIVVFVHELGHFVIGRAVGAKVDVFSIGIGPEVVGMTTASGIRWRLSVLPLGGYVRFAGDADAIGRPALDPAIVEAVFRGSGMLLAKSKWQRACVMLAGPAANVLFSVVVSFGIFLAYGRHDLQPIVSAITENSPAVASGLMAGDHILSVDGDEISTLREFRDALHLSSGRPVLLVISRNGRAMQGTITPQLIRAETLLGSQSRYVIGIQVLQTPENQVIQSFGVASALREGFAETIRMARLTISSINNVLFGRMAMDDLAGPVKVAYLSQVVVHIGGLQGFMRLLAIISVSLAVINLMPIPTLDGGHVLIIVIEALIGRPMSLAALDVFYRVGMGLILCLVVIATANDIITMWSL